jgi:plastocyanin
MSQVWSIMINGAVPAKFTPDVFGTSTGQPLQAQVGDLVSWNNQTADKHQIQVKVTPAFTTKEILAGKPSTPGYVVQAANKGTTITYVCTLHLDKEKNPTETGTIEVAS